MCEGVRGKKSVGKRLDVVFVVMVMWVFECGMWGVVWVWSDAEAGGRCSSEARWDA